MAFVIIKLRVMPENVEVDLNILKTEVVKIIKKFTGREEDQEQIEMTPVAFGLTGIDITFKYDEKKGGTDPLEDLLRNTENVGGVEVLETRRAMG